MENSLLSTRSECVLLLADMPDEAMEEALELLQDLRTFYNAPLLTRTMIKTIKAEQRKAKSPYAWKDL